MTSTAKLAIARDFDLEKEIVRTVEFQALMKAVGDSLDDDLPRLVLADFLDENGLHDRANHIRAMIEVSRKGEDKGWRTYIHHRRESYGRWEWWGSQKPGGTRSRGSGWLPEGYKLRFLELPVSIRRRIESYTSHRGFLYSIRAAPLAYVLGKIENDPWIPALPLLEMPGSTPPDITVLSIYSKVFRESYPKVKSWMWADGQRVFGYSNDQTRT